MISRQQLTARLRGIRLLVCDVDGVLTNGKIILDGAGLETKEFCAQDGLGLSLARLGGLQTAFLSARESKVVQLRARECGVHYVMQGKRQKGPAFQELCGIAGVAPAAVLYMGDDLMDLPVLKTAGLAVAVSNAAAEVKKAAHYITRARGGDGAVREVVELILHAQGAWKKALSQFLGRDAEKN